MIKGVLDAILLSCSVSEMCCTSASEAQPLVATGFSALFFAMAKEGLRMSLHCLYNIQVMLYHTISYIILYYVLR